MMTLPTLAARGTGLASLRTVAGNRMDVAVCVPANQRNFFRSPT